MMISIPGALFLIFFGVFAIASVVKTWQEGKKLSAFKDIAIVIIGNAIFVYGSFPLAFVWYVSVLSLSLRYVEDERWTALTIDQKISSFGIALTGMLIMFGFFQWLR